VDHPVGRWRVERHAPALRSMHAVRR